jgi:hypothetical protein
MRMAKSVFHIVRNHVITALAWLLIFASVRLAMEDQHVAKVVRQTSGVDSVTTNVDVKMTPLVILTMELVDARMDIKDRIAVRSVLLIDMARIVQKFAAAKMMENVIMFPENASVLVAGWGLCVKIRHALQFINQCPLF